LEVVNGEFRHRVAHTCPACHCARRSDAAIPYLRSCGRNWVALYAGDCRFAAIALRRHIQHNHIAARLAATDGPGCCTFTRASSPLSSERRTRPLMPPSAAAPPEQYRQKWGLPSDYPMVAPNYAERRSVLAKSIGLGRKPAPVVAPEPVEAPFQPVHRGRPPKQTATEQSIPRMTNGLLRGI
jgi:hypothetical protein